METWKDTFTDADLTNLQDHVPDVGTAYTFFGGNANAQIVSNKLKYAGGAITNECTYELDDQEQRNAVCTFTAHITSITGFARFAFRLRYDFPAFEGVVMGVYRSGASAAVFVDSFKGFSEVYVEKPVTFNTGTDYQFRAMASGDELSIYWDDVLVLRVRNALFGQQKGLQGLNFAARNADFTIDDFSVFSLEDGMIALKTGQWNAHREGVAELLKVAGQALCDGTALAVTAEIRLFTSANAPGCDDEVADYTEATFSGYAPVLIDSGGDGCTDILEIGTNVDGVGQIVIDQQAWTEGSPATITETVNGAYLVLIDGANELLLGSFVFDNPVGMAAAGDVLKVAGFMLLDCQMV